MNNSSSRAGGGGTAGGRLAGGGGRGAAEVPSLPVLLPLIGRGIFWALGAGGAAWPGCPLAFTALIPEVAPAPDEASMAVDFLGCFASVSAANDGRLDGNFAPCDVDAASAISPLPPVRLDAEAAASDMMTSVSPAFLADFGMLASAFPTTGTPCKVGEGGSALTFDFVLSFLILVPGGAGSSAPTGAGANVLLSYCSVSM